MSPAHHRYVFGAFALMIAGVMTNVMLLQPAQAPGTAHRSAADSKAEAERRQKLALDQPADMRQEQLALESLIKRAAATSMTGAPDGSVAQVRTTSGRMQPTSTQIAMEQGPRRFARLRQDAAQASAADRLPDVPDVEGNADVIKAIQRELTGRGYGPLVADGVPGLVTRAAVMAFEHDSRLPLTGEATGRLLGRLQLSAAQAALLPADPAAGKVRSQQAELVIRTVQQSLAALGYQVGKGDGRSSDDVARAIQEFELDEGLTPTGRVSAEVFARLGRVVAAAKPRTAQ